MAPRSATALLAIAFALIVIHSVRYVRALARMRAAHSPEPATARPVTRKSDPMWGTVSMAIMSTGSALLSVGPHLGLSDALTVSTDTAMWALGTVIGVVTNVWFLAHAFETQEGLPVHPWGLGLVAPMVSATVGAVLTPHYASPAAAFLTLIISFACFVLSLFTGLALFITSYLTQLRGRGLPMPLALSAWVPLGVVGQSMAAAVAMSRAARPILTPAAHTAAVGIARA